MLLLSQSIGGASGAASQTLRPPSPLSPHIHNKLRLNNLGNARETLRNGQVLVPSAGFANEATRVRNNGRRLCTDRNPTLKKSTSEPALSGNSSLPWLVSGMSALTTEAKTPRTLRGQVRKTSAVQIVVPDTRHIMSKTLPGRWLSTQSFQRSKDSKLGLNESVDACVQGINPGPSATDSNSTSPKRVRWADGHEATTISGPAALSGIVKEGMPSQERIRCMQLMDSLYKLRRIGGNDNAGDEATNAEGAIEQAAKEEEKQLSLMHSALSGVNDTEAELRATIVTMASAHDPVCELGGARHATTLITGRALSVVKRKADLVARSEENLKKFEALHAKREEFCSQVVAGVFDLPEGYRGVKRMIAALVHRNPNGAKGNPAEADKTNFDIFASSFGLHPNHSTLVRLKALAMEATEWWADKMLEEAYAGSDAFVLQRLIDVTCGFLNLSSHEKVTQVRDILGTRGAEKVFSIAQGLAAKDAQVVKNSLKAQPEHAKQVAEEIDREIKKAVSLGATIKHPLMEQARSIAVSFHLEEKNRFALRALQFAYKKQDEDNKMVEEAGDSVPPVGPASEAGDLIEREVNTAIKLGARPDHERLVEAQAIMKSLRDEDGNRKRLAAREKRIAAKAGSS